MDDGISLLSLNSVYSEEDLQSMTKSQIADLASELGYSVNINDTKTKMINDFMEQQN